MKNQSSIKNNKLKEIRISKNLTQNEVASQLNIFNYFDKDQKHIKILKMEINAN